MKLSLNHNSSIPLHAQVEKLLREMTKKTEYINGLPLPKEVDLAKRLGISRNTIRQATNKLVYEGLLTRKKGVGTYVAKKVVTTNLENWLSFTQEMNDKGISFINYDIHAEFIKPTAEIASVLGIPVEKEILRLDRVRGTKDGPFVWFISYFHPRIGLSGKEDFTRPLYDILENDLSTVPSFSREKIKAIKGTKEINSRLELQPGEPVLLREREVLDPGERIIEYNVCYYRGDQFTYTIEIKK